MLTITKETILKYDVPGPRYTSYPTAPEWSDSVSAATYQEKLRRFAQSDKTLSLYVHIPFCESLCYFCACTVVIRRQDEKYGEEYLDYLLQEMDLVSRSIGTKKEVKQLHWGGGTPNFLTEPQMERLYIETTKRFDIDRDGEIAVEIDPRTITKPKIKKLRDLGFNRVSMGIQDFDIQVQEAIHRIQPFDKVKEITDYCRHVGFHSINFDLIYGLPHQTKEHFADTVQKVISLRPDRIALYSFAYVPWLKKHQAKFALEDLPSNDEKLDIFLQSRSQFLDNGYQAIAMDHFALKTDELAKAFNRGTLYRNFMGYTVKPADEYIGLGMSAIGFLENTFIHNSKTLPGYYRHLTAGQLPVDRGKVLTRDDQVRRWVISSFMCRFAVDKHEFKNEFTSDFDEYFADEQLHIERCIEDGLLKVSGSQIQVTGLGRIFIRNICMGFDWYLRQEKAHRKFSRTV